jgi:hypothetical protein
MYLTTELLFLSHFFVIASRKAYFFHVGGLKLLLELLKDPQVDESIRVMLASVIWNYTEFGPLLFLSF